VGPARRIRTPRRRRIRAFENGAAGSRSPSPFWRERAQKLIDAPIFQDANSTDQRRHFFAIIADECFCVALVGFFVLLAPAVVIWLWSRLIGLL
jgi:hypothetical protein